MLPDGWMYEGWVVGSNGPVSTGKFTDASGVDSDGTGPDAGKDPGPPFPGEDFVMPATMLDSSYKAVITVEPDPDNSPMPFAVKPLVAASIDGTKTAPDSQQMSAGPAMPTGTATIMAVSACMPCLGARSQPRPRRPWRGGQPVACEWGQL